MHPRQHTAHRKRDNTWNLAAGQAAVCSPPSDDMASNGAKAAINKAKSLASSDSNGKKRKKNELKPIITGDSNTNRCVECTAVKERPVKSQTTHLAITVGGRSAKGSRARAR